MTLLLDQTQTCFGGWQKPVKFMPVHLKKTMRQEKGLFLKVYSVQLLNE